MMRTLKSISRQRAFVVLGILLFAVIGTESQPWADNPFSEWSHRSAVAISNPGGMLLSNFQVHLSLDSTFDFSKAKPDGSDVRFTTDDGETPIPFWIESWNTDTRTASIWIRVPTIPSSGTTTYLYYGNPSATSASDGDGTFEFFDDFESADRITLGYYQLSTPQTILVQDQAWEDSAPHSLSVVENNSGGYTYWGYYGLQADRGGIGLAFSNDLINWTKYSGNPLFLNGRWPSVLKIDGVFYMLYTRDFMYNSYINLAVSNDGITFQDVKTIVQREPWKANQNPNLYYNPNDGRYYLYWYSGDDYSYWQIRARSAATPEGLDDPSSEILVMESDSTLAAPNMIFRDGTYFLSTETLDGTGQWAVKIFSSVSPTSGFSLLPGNPVLAEGSACNFQTVVGTSLHDYYCKFADNTWTLEHRLADLTAGRLEFQGEVPDSTKWTASGGSWVGITDTQQDGSEGTALLGTIGNDTWLHVLLSSYSGGDYVLETWGKQMNGRVWGLGARATDRSNLYSVNLYEDLDGTNNLYVYNWFSGGASEIASTATGAVDADTWYKISVKVHGDLIDVYKDNVLRLQTASSQHGSGRIALYGEQNTAAKFNNVLVRKYAAIEPSTEVSPSENPMPVTTGLSPSSATAGGAAFTLTVTGSNFMNGSVVRWNGSDRDTTYISSSQVTAAIPASDIATIGTASVTVFNSAPGGGTSNAQNFTVLPTLVSIGLNPTTVTGGSSSEGTVTLSGPAPSGGAVVSLSDNSSAASVPSSVTVPAGSTSATFTVSTTTVTATTSATISAVYGGATKTALLTITAPAVTLSTLSLNPTTVTGGSSSEGTVTLSGPAPSGGAVVSLRDNSFVASVPSSVTVPAGSSSATFTVTTRRVFWSQYVTITATYNGVSRSAVLRVTR